MASIEIESEDARLPPGIEGGGHQRAPSLAESRPWEKPAVDRHFVDDFPTEIGMDEHAAIWATYRDKATEVHGDMIDTWDKTMDVLLIFSALFSAILTAFLILSLGLLFPDKAQATVDALMVVSAQLNALNNPGSSPPSPYQPTDPFVPNAISVWINVLWILSLTISLFTSVLAMLAKQWCRAYAANISSVARQGARQRHFRYMGVLEWRVPAIINSLPVLLHVAVFMFLIGFMAFLWPVNTVLFAVMAAIWIAGAVAYVLLAVAPLIWYNCPFKSPLTSVVEFCVGLRLAKLSLSHATSSETSWWNIPRHLLAIIRDIRDMLRTTVVEFPWLEHKTDELIERSDIYLDTCAMGWLERACTDQTEKESVLFAMFGSKTDNVFQEQFAASFSDTAGRAISLLLQQETGNDNSLSEKTTPEGAVKLLVHLAIFTSYNPTALKQWPTWYSQPWAHPEFPNPEDTPKALLCLASVVWAGGNIPVYGSSAFRNELYASAMPEFCRAFERPEASISLFGCWLLLEHLRTVLNHYEELYGFDVPPPAAVTQLLSELRRFVATSRNLPPRFLDTVRRLWHDENTIPGYTEPYGPASQAIVSWNEILGTVLSQDSRNAALSYILHNIDGLSRNAHKADEPLNLDNTHTVYRYIVKSFMDSDYPPPTGPLLDSEHIKEVCSLEVRTAEECARRVIDANQWDFPTPEDTLAALQLFDLQSPIIKRLLGTLQRDGQLDSIAFDAVAGTPTFSEFIRFAREKKDHQATVISTLIIWSRGYLFYDEYHDYNSVILDCGWLELAVEYGYQDVFLIDDAHCKTMQETIMHFGDPLIPHLGKLANLVKRYPPANMVEGFEDLIDKASQYVSQQVPVAQQHLPTSATGPSPHGMFPGLGRWIHPIRNTSKADLEHGTLPTTPPGPALETEPVSEKDEDVSVTREV